MTKDELGRRQERAERETFIISRTDEGFRVYSPERPTKSFTVSGSPEEPSCSCLDFQTHDGDRQWRCKHILAALDQFHKGNGRNDEADSYDREERLAIQSENEEAAQSNNGAAQMLLKRSVSPDGRIDSLSVEFSIPVGISSAKAVREDARDLLGLQSVIVKDFLNGGGNGNGQPVRVNGNSQENGFVPAQMLSVGGMNGKWGRRLFINFQVNGQVSKLFGSQKQLAEHIAIAGYPEIAERIVEGMPLNLPCRVFTKPSEDGRFLNVERVMPDGRVGQ